jgi:sortase A
LVYALLLLGGAAALGWCAYVATSAFVVQRLAREKLQSTAPLTPMETAASPVPLGTALAELSIPSIGLSAVVLEGSDDHTLRMGVGHIETTPLPGGEFGNVAIAGHRDTFFRPLRNIRVGDDVLLNTPEKRAHYRVSWFRVVGPDDVSVIDPTADPTLTLVTCYPFWFIGSAPDRFVVRAKRVDDAVAPDALGDPLEPNHD